MEYRPIERDITTYGGWDLAQVEREHKIAKQYITPATVEDLGDVDLESLGMSLRSRLGSEVSYALTVLAMLSMPGEGDDKGGLALHHCGDLLQDLVELAEDAAFGEDGWADWSERANVGASDLIMMEGDEAVGNATSWQSLIKGKWRASYTTLTKLAANREQDCVSFLHGLWSDGESSRMAVRRSLIQQESAIFNHRRSDIAMVAINLLRNFSMMNDNYTHMANNVEFLNLIARICDLRLVTIPGGRLERGANGPANFTLSDLVRLRRDALDVFWNLGENMDLTVLPEDTSIRLFDLLASFLSDSELSASSSLSSGDFHETQVSQTTWLLDSALTALSRIGLRDCNRRVMRRLEADWIVDVFTSVLALLPSTHADFMRVRQSPLAIDMQHRLGFCLYNLAFAASLEVRARLRSIPGTLSVLTRVIKSYSAYAHTIGNISLHVASRRLIETISVLNGPDELTGAGRNISFGGAASERGLKGWNDSSASCIEPGLLAHQEDFVIDMIFSQELDSEVFAELDRAVWA